MATLTAQVSKAKARVLKTQKARVSNVPEMLANVDQRTAIARRYRDVGGALISDQGGVERLSEARLQMVRRLAGLCVLCEDVESKIAMGGAVDLTAYGPLCNNMSRIAQRLGLNRVAKDVPTLQAYIASKQPSEESV
jgi:hypothetical protein